MSRNPRYYGPGGWRARVAAIDAVRRRAAAGEACAICGAPFDPAAPRWIVRPDGRRVLAPWSVECDEALPISLGGSPTSTDNVRPVHRVCNQRRGNKIEPRAGAVAAPPSPHAPTDGAQGARW